MSKKFEIGRKCIPNLFGDLCEREPEQFALFGWGSETRKELAGARVIHVKRLMAIISKNLGRTPISNAAVPESFPILRTIQYMVDKGQGLGFSREFFPKGKVERVTEQIKGHWLDQ